MSLTVTPEDVGQAKAAAPEGSAVETTSSGKQPEASVDLPEHLKGQIDPEAWSKLPADAQATLDKLGKSLVGDYTRKSQDLAETRRLKESLEANPEQAEVVRKALAEHQARRAGVLPKTDAQAVSSAKSRIDQLRDDAEPDQREAMDRLVAAFDERYKGDLAAKAEKIDQLEEQVKSLLTERQETRKETLHRELKELPATWKALGEKHQDQILRMGSSKSGMKLSAMKLLLLAAEPEEVLATAKTPPPDQPKPSVERTRQTAVGKPSSAVGTPEAMADSEKVVARDRRYGSTWSMGRVVTKLLSDLKRGLPSA